MSFSETVHENMGLSLSMAERVGFEPTVGANPRQFSRLLP